jgi:hypothetical protein
MRRRAWIAVGVVAAAGLGVGGWLLARGLGGSEGERLRGFGDYRFTDPSKVHFGRPDFARRPGTVDSSRVYDAIPEYQQIVRERLGDDTPKYHLLMQKASQRFHAAVEAAARAQDADAVAEQGTVVVVREGAPAPRDLTDAARAEVR